jgi:N-acetylmuramoyl-L-alanine amidase
MGTFIVLTKRSFLAIGSVVVLCACIVLAFNHDSQARTVMATTEDFHVVIDAGHGGFDGGAVSSNGTKESDINLLIAKNLRQELIARGAGVTMTRLDKNGLYSPFVKNRKRDDMQKRERIIEQANADLVISIHLNKFPGNSSVRGLQTFYAKGSEAGKAFAEAIQREVNSKTQNNHRFSMIGDYYILQRHDTPAVLVECGFLSNPIEEQLLKTNEYQKILAYHIANAVIAQHHLNQQHTLG